MDKGEVSKNNLANQATMEANRDIMQIVDRVEKIEVKDIQSAIDEEIEVWQKKDVSEEDRREVLLKAIELDLLVEKARQNGKAVSFTFGEGKEKIYLQPYQGITASIDILPKVTKSAEFTSRGTLKVDDGLTVRQVPGDKLKVTIMV